MWSGRCIQKQIWPKLCWTRRLGGLRCVRHTFPKAQIHTTPACPDFKYGWFHGVEKLDRYERGGYHPVAIDEVLHDRYRIVDKLGHGGYSTVWLAHDSQHDHLVAVKIGISGSSSTGGESSTLYKLSRSPLRNTHGAEFVPTLLDSFSVQGPNGVHMCLVMDITDGDLHTAKSNRLFPISVARALAAKLALATQAIHSYGIIHGGLLLNRCLRAMLIDWQISDSAMFILDVTISLPIRRQRNSGSYMVNQKLLPFKPKTAQHCQKTYRDGLSNLYIWANVPETTR